MSFKDKIKSALFHAVGKKTREEREKEIIEFVKELIRVKKRTPKNKEEKVEFLRQDHFLDSIRVLDKQGNVIISTGEEGERKKALELFNRVKDMFPEAKMLVIKEEGKYNIIYQNNGLIYMFKSPGEVSSIETRVIAEKLNVLR